MREGVGWFAAKASMRTFIFAGFISALVCGCGQMSPRSNGSASNGSWVDAESRIEYVFTTQNPTRWPDIIVIAEFDDTASARTTNVIMRGGTIYFRGTPVATNHPWCAWLELTNSLTEIRLSGSDVVSNDTAIAAEPSKSLVAKVLRLREGAGPVTRGQ
jgi:hypothetical protein